MHSSLRTLAIIIFLATISAAVFTNTSTFTYSLGEKAYADLKNTSCLTNSSSRKVYFGPEVLGLPSPGTKPDLDYNFNVIFKGGKCTASQQATILKMIADIAGLSDRTKLWENDTFHDWQPEVNYWFGDRSQSQDGWIKSNAILSSGIDLVVKLNAR